MLEEIINNLGGYWGVGHPDYPPEDWQYEVANGDTRKGYWKWVFAQIQDQVQEEE